MEPPFRRVCMADADDKQTTADYWSDNLAGSNPFSPQLYWLAVPRVQRRFQRQACAGADHPSWVHYCVEAFVRPRTPLARMLSIGCGSGTLERELYALGAFVTCDAIDIAPGAIAQARQEARAIGAEAAIHYRVEDVEHTPLAHQQYDAIWFNEYVGANHFDFGATQRAAMAHAFGLIPQRYRRSFVAGHGGQVLDAVLMPDPREVARVDPSEAVRSSDILSVVRQHFDIVAENPCGGTLLQFVLHGIAGNFREEDPGSMVVLEMLFAIEDALITSGALRSDFVAVAARPKPLPH